MKQLIILICTVSTLMVAQDAAGQYKLTGVDVLYTYVARGDYTLTITDAYGFGVIVPVASIPGGAPFTAQAMQLTTAALSAVGINLNVTLNEDGTGELAEGSYYPDVNTIQDENGNCVTLQQVLPVTEPFLYESMANGMAAIGIAHPGINVLGMPGISTKAGQQMGLLGLSQSETFEDYPMIPFHPTICAEDGSCFPFTIGDIDGSGSLEIYPETNTWGIPEYVPGGAPLTGVTGGFWQKVGVNTDDLSSVFPGNTAPDFHLEWHGVDGESAGLGQGPYYEGAVEEDDEDNDGTWFDRQIGIPGITATYINPAAECGGFTQPIYGDVSELFGDCVDEVGDAASGYLMDATLAPWGNFLTAHAAIFQQCVASLGEATCAGIGGGILLVDDSGSDVDISCLADYNPADITTLLDCAGRLTMNFDIPCVGIIEAREVVAEFIEVGGFNCGSGNVSGDAEGDVNVLDVVALVNCVLSGTCDDCAGDLNSDGTYNVLDVVALVNCVLANSCGSGRIDSATSVEFNVIGNEVTMTADGVVGGIQMTLSHGSDFALTLIDGGQYSNYLTEGNTTTLIIVNPASDNLFTTSGDFTIESVIVSDVTGSSKLSSSVNMLKDYSISAAYPNPFNPTTQMSLTLNTAADVSVQVFNMNGQLIDVIASGNLASGNYSFTWDATSAPSGVYFIKTEVGSEINSQKIMLIK